MAQQKKPQARRRKKQRKLYRNARRELRLERRAPRQDIAQDYGQAVKGVESAFGGYENMRDDIPEFKTNATMNAFEENLGQAAAMAPQYLGMPEGEMGAAQGVLAGIQGTTAAELASMAARSNMMQESYGNEAALAQRAALMNLEDERLQALDELRITPMDVRSMVEQLKEQRFARRRLNEGTKSERAFREYMEAQIGTSLSHNNRRRKRDNKKGNK